MIEIIPAIDIISGKCVRLCQGDYAQKKVYNENPLEVAKMFEGSGIRRLHLVDLDGAKEGRIINYKVLEQIASKTKLIVDFGGGLKSNKDVEIAFNSGAKMVTGGSIAVKNRELFLQWLETYGSEKIILGADVKDDMIAVSGWMETSSQEIIPFLHSYAEEGVRKVISTDVSKDGMLQGTSIELYKRIIAEVEDVYLIASGGVKDINDVIELEKIGAEGVIIGKAIYEGNITLKELIDFVH